MSVSNEICWGAQAASLFVSAACRDADVAGKLPATAGWQPALPSPRTKKTFTGPISRISRIIESVRWRA